MKIALKCYLHLRINFSNTRWMEGLRFYVLFNSILFISGQWAYDNEKLCAMEPRLRLKRSRSHAGLRLTRGSNLGDQ